MTTLTTHADFSLVRRDSPMDDQLVVLLGGLDSRVAYAAERFEMPILALPVYQLAEQAIKAALAMRQCVVLTAPRGTAKTESVLMAEARHKRSQGEMLAANPERHEVMRTLVVTRFPGRTVRECVLQLLRAVSPHAVRERETGSRLNDEDLLTQAVAAMLLRRIALIIVDEGETLTDAGIECLRRVLATAQAVYGDKMREKALDTDTRSAVGVGMVIAGTAEIADRLRATEDLHGRWAMFLSAEGLDSASVPRIYRHIFPGFEPAIAAMGESAWDDLIQRTVVRGRRLTMRQIENHARYYFTVLYDASLPDDPEAPLDDAILVREEAPFDETRFAWAWTQLDAPAVSPAAAEVAKRRVRQRRRTS